MAVLRITARRAGFRRAGVAHPATPVEHPAERFTAGEIARLEAEPMLIVERVEPASAGGGESASSGAEAPAGKGGRQRAGRRVRDGA